MGFFMQFPIGPGERLKTLSRRGSGWRKGKYAKTDSGCCCSPGPPRGIASRAMVNCTKETRFFSASHPTPALSNGIIQRVRVSSCKVFVSIGRAVMCREGIMAPAEQPFCRGEGSRAHPRGHVSAIFHSSRVGMPSSVVCR
jgi:hypothetical protein